MAEGWVRRLVSDSGIEVEVHSAGTEATRVKPEAIEVMSEVGIDIGDHFSKSLLDLPDPWRFDLVLTVCDEARESCPAYPAHTTRLHVSFPDPSGESLARWREVRDGLGRMARLLVEALADGRLPTEEELRQQPQ